MTAEMEYLIYLYASGACGVSAAPPENAVDYDLLLKLAREQNVTSVVAYAVKLSPELDIPGELKNMLYGAFFGETLKMKDRRENIASLLALLEKNGLHPVVLKGMDTARFYALPECRASADTDIYIEEKDEQRALELLSDAGFDITPRKESSHHTVCRSVKYGMVELHVKLCDDELADASFGELATKCISDADSRRVSACGSEISVLDATHALLYMSLHFIKHFIRTGAGICMIYDTALYFSKNRSQIDCGFYWSTIESLGCAKLMNTLFCAMIRYGNFSCDDFPGMTRVDDETVALFCDDVERGGYHGANIKNLRRDAWFYFQMKKRAEKKGGLPVAVSCFYQNTKYKLWVLFPPLSVLKQKYPYLERRGFLYPAAWLHRLFTRGAKAAKSGKANDPRYALHKDKLSETARESIAVFEKTDIL